MALLSVRSKSTQKTSMFAGFLSLPEPLLQEKPSIRPCFLPCFPKLPLETGSQWTASATTQSSETRTVQAASRKAAFAAISRDFIKPILGLCGKISVSEALSARPSPVAKIPFPTAEVEMGGARERKSTPRRARGSRPNHFTPRCDFRDRSAAPRLQVASCGMAVRPHLLQQGRKGWPLCCLGTAATLCRRNAGRLPVTAQDDLKVFMRAWPVPSLTYVSLNSEWA
jgi:hypothetical protein